MSEINEELDFSEKDMDKRISVFFAIVITFIVSIMGGYSFWFYVIHKKTPSSNVADWGAFGDFFGGTINPVISLFTLIIVAAAFLLQRKELTNTATALKASAEEQEIQSKIAIIQGEININIAMLNRRTSDRNAIALDIQRMGNIEELRGGPLKFILASTGEKLCGLNERQHEIKRLLAILQEMDRQISDVEEELMGLYKDLAEISLTTAKNNIF